MQVLNAMSGDSTECPQKSEDLQEKAIPSAYTQDSNMLLKHTEASETAKGPAPIGMIINTGNSSNANKTDSLVKKEVVHKDIVGTYIGESTTFQKVSLDLCDYSTNTIQNNSLGLYDYRARTVQNATLQNDSQGLLQESIKFQKNSLNSSHDLLVGGDSQMEMQKSDVSVFKTDSSSTDPKAGTENKVPFSTEGYYGRSVSVQMCSGLASQSSLRGNISQSPSTGHSPNSDVQLKKESREQFSSDVTNISDNVQSTNTPTTKEHTLPDPWHSQESFKGPHSISLDKNRSYEDDTRWVAALLSGGQSCGSCGYNQRCCCCQNKNSEKQNCSSPEQLQPASRLPVSHS